MKLEIEIPKDDSESRTLQPIHLADLKRSGLNDETIRKAGIFSVTKNQAQQLLHRWHLPSKGYAIPYFKQDGSPLLQQNGQVYVNIKLDAPLLSGKGKQQKYLKPTGEPNALYFPPEMNQRIQNSSELLIFTEGEKKCLKAAQEGYPCIALPGVWGFKTRKGKTPGRSIPLPELDTIPMSQREIYIVFDSDLSSNPKVQQAEQALAQYLQNRGAIVYSLRLPAVLDEAKIGLDDFLIKQGKAALHVLMENARTTNNAHSKAVVSIHSTSSSLPADIADEFLIGQNFQSDRGLKLRFYREEWFRYDGQTFQPFQIPDLKSKIVEHLRAGIARGKATHSFVNNILLHLQSLCAIPSSVTLPASLTKSGWVTSPDCLTLSNGILDLHSLLRGEPATVLSPLNPSFVSMVGVPFEFNPKATCPQWRHFLEEILPNPDGRLLLKEIFGYCLTYDTSLQKFFLFEGIGANGKGVVLRILTRLLGETNVSSLPLELFGAAHDLVTTLGKLVNITSDLGELDRVAEGLLKQFTGDDYMHFNPKYRTPYSAKPTAKLIIAANVRPPFRDRSEGIWRRLVILPFPTQIPPEKQNSKLTDELTGELPGILNWAIAGAFSLRKRKHFLESKDGVLARQQFQRESNPARLFLEESCERDLTGEIPSIFLYQEYAKFCQNRGFHPLNETHFGREVRATFAQVERIRLPVQGESSRPWGYRGLKWLERDLSHQSY
ncbi:MAG: DUF3854 domain-containing protein [Nitrospira sp.]|nr:DUF3854 domain-containing protein [Nitrospira sp.]